MHPTMVGVVPAAGRAVRLGRPSTSKELEPVWVDPARPGGPRPVVFRLLTALAEAPVERALVVTSAAKQDVRDALGSGDTEGTPPLEHLVVEDSPASTYSISIGTEAAGERLVALGFPDVLWEGERAFSRLADRLLTERADVAIGLFPSAPDYATHGVVLDGKHLKGFEPPGRTTGLPTWTLAVWKPVFSRLLEREVALAYGPWMGAPPSEELTMTSVLARALEAGLSIATVQISDRPFLDIGDPARLEKARAACRPPEERGGSRAT